YAIKVIKIKKAKQSMFFFSSRRRHTRSKRDWSSDVCSSDLVLPAGGEGEGAAGEVHQFPADVSAIVPAGARVVHIETVFPGRKGTEGRCVGKRGSVACGCFIYLNIDS